MVLFDMDGLLDTEWVCMRCCFELGREYGLLDMTDGFAHLIGLRGVGSRPILEAALRGRVDHDTFVKRWGALIDARLRTETAKKHLKAAGLLGFLMLLPEGIRFPTVSPIPRFITRLLLRLDCARRIASFLKMVIQAFEPPFNPVREWLKLWILSSHRPKLLGLGILLRQI
ncbi:MAG: hypothetical protein ABGW81_07845 [Paracoccaceae bacterium]